MRDLKIVVKLVVIAVIIVILGIVVASAGASGLSGKLWMPIAFKGGQYPGAPTHTATPTPTIVPTLKPTRTPTPPPTPTPEPELKPAAESTYDWVYVGRAGNIGEQIEIYAVVAGQCYDFVLHHFEYTPDGKLAVLIAREIVEGAWWCSVPPYNPDAVWPPPQSPPPPVLPPDFGYGDTQKKTFNWNAAIVCGVKDWDAQEMLNCEPAQKVK